MLELGVGGGVKNKLNYPVEAILRVLIGGLFTWPPVPGAEEGGKHYLGDLTKRANCPRLL
jgi:hypothetical protein